MYLDCETCRDVFSVTALYTSVVEWKILHVLQFMNLETDLPLWLCFIFMDNLCVLLDFQSDSA